MNSLSQVLSLLYNDRMTVYKYTSDDNGNPKLNDSPSLENVPCRISFGSTADKFNDLQQAENPTKLYPTIFCKTDVQVDAGDVVLIERLSGDAVYAEYRGLLGMAKKYASQQEIPLIIDENA